MKKIGLVGGSGPESTIDYYRSIINLYRSKTDDNSYPRLIIDSINMTEMLNYVELNQLDRLKDFLLNALINLKNAGAELAAIAANTPHIIFDELNKVSPLPLLSIIEETFKVVKTKNLKKVGLFGTKFTMQEDFFKKVFNDNGITIITPGMSEQNFIHDKIMSELDFGKVVASTKNSLLKIIERLKTDEKIEGLILGCTELPIILEKSDENGITFFNTTKIHVESIVNNILS